MLSMKRSLAMSGGHILINSSLHYLAEENIDINTPDIDPSFFDLNDDPFKKLNSFVLPPPSAMELTEPETAGVLDDSSLGSSQPSLDGDNHFIDLSQLICATTPEVDEICVVPNEVLDTSCYSPILSTASSPVYHSLQTLDTSQSSVNESQAFDTTVNIPLMDTIDTTTQEAFDFLQPTVPTVINDHLYTRATNSPPMAAPVAVKTETKDRKYVSRKKNNAASKKSRLTKRDKQKQMEEKIVHYLADNKRCHEMIDQMEKEIAWCKTYLFQKVMQAKR